MLQQRNAQLRAAPGASELAPWDLELEALGGRLHELRSSHLSRILPRVAKLTAELAGVEVSIHYKPGWDETLRLSEALAMALPRDAARGHTGLGPHRADLDLRIEAKPANQVLSRGEAKLLCLALWLAQARDFQEQSGRSPLVLIDDLAAELDADNRVGALTALSEAGIQAFITSVSEALLNQAAGEVTGFHMERGKALKMV